MSGRADWATRARAQRSAQTHGLEAAHGIVASIGWCVAVVWVPLFGLWLWLPA